MAERTVLACSFCTEDIGTDGKNLVQARRKAKASGWSARQHPTEPGPMFDICPECTKLNVFDELVSRDLL